MLAAMLSRLSQTQTADPSTAAVSTASATDSASSGTSNALTGTDTSTLSDKVIGILVMMQGQSQGSEPSGSDTGTSGAADPLQQAFSSIDTNGDGAISQSELETTIQNAGGTASQADSVYSALGGSDSAGISESQFASAAQAGGPPPGGPPPGGAHGHHRHGSSDSLSDASTKVFNALDANKDGTVSADELAAGLAGTTGKSSGSSTVSDTSSSTAATSSDILSSIDSNGDGSVSQAELTAYMKSLQQQAQSDLGSLNAFMSLADQSYSSTMGLSSGSSTSQSMYA
jgi:Ca2+-binding EF-hand superfamily protein